MFCKIILIYVFLLSSFFVNALNAISDLPDWIDYYRSINEDSLGGKKKIDIKELNSIIDQLSEIINNFDKAWNKASDKDKTQIEAKEFPFSVLLENLRYIKTEYKRCFENENENKRCSCKDFVNSIKSYSSGPTQYSNRTLISIKIANMICQ